MMLIQENNGEEIRFNTLMLIVEIFKTQRNELKHNLHVQQVQLDNMKEKYLYFEG